MKRIESEYIINSNSFNLPERDATQSLLEMYLHKRGISYAVIGYFKQHGEIYQHRRSNNGKQFSITFVGKDVQGNPRYAAIQNIEYAPKAIRSGDTEMFVFDSDDAEVVSGSDERYGFSYEGGNEHLYLFDSFITSLAFATSRSHARHFRLDDNFIAFPSTNYILQQTDTNVLPPVLSRFLSEQSAYTANIKHIHFGFKDTPDGQQAARKIAHIMGTEKNQELSKFLTR